MLAVGVLAPLALATGIDTIRTEIISVQSAGTAAQPAASRATPANFTVPDDELVDSKRIGQLASPAIPAPNLIKLTNFVFPAPSRPARGVIGLRGVHFAMPPPGPRVRALRPRAVHLQGPAQPDPLPDPGLRLRRPMRRRQRRLRGFDPLPAPGPPGTHIRGQQ